MTSFVIDRDPRNDTLPQGSRGCGAIGFSTLVEAGPGLSMLRHTQQFQQVVFTCGCVCARVLTPHHEDETLMIQMRAYLSLAPLVVGPSAASRESDSTLGAAPIRFSLGIISRARCLVG